jgi:hypothetical protein
MKTITITLPVKNAKALLGVYESGWDTDYDICQYHDGEADMAEDVRAWREQLDNAAVAEQILRDALKAAGE